MRTRETELFAKRGVCSQGDAVSASAVFITVLIFTLLAICSGAAPGARSAHMASHILTMNAIAPAAALCWLRFWPAQGVFASDRALIAGFVIQIGVFYAWHLPGVIGGAESSPPFHATLHLALLGSAFLFWGAILSLEASALWRGVIALTLTGKLACLLGALLLLSPRLVGGGAEAGFDRALDDQRVAGLMMLAACPFCYLATAVHLAAEWLRGVEARAARGFIGAAR